MLSAHKLAELTAAAGHDPGEDALKAICSIPGNFLQAEAVYRKVRTYKFDRKTYEDRGPHIQRHRDGYAPMDAVCGDIHPVDIQVRRADGSIATPRMIAWLDLGTNRIWADFVLLEKREGIRNAHVIASFIAMVQAWGAPRRLYLDNGSEYNFAEFIDDALQLVDRDRRRYIDVISPYAEGSGVRRAQPHAPSSKPIEGIFGILERSHFSTIKGWIAGDRMKKPTQAIGKPVDPFPGTFADLRQALCSRLSEYDVTPQKGTLKGRSPRAVYAAAVASGWQMTAVDANAFRIAFSRQETRVVHQGSVRYGGRLWTCRELQAYQRETVTLLVPKYEDWSCLPVRDDRGELMGFAVPDKAYGFFDREGAVEAKERRAAGRAEIRALDRSAPDLDVSAERAAYMRSLPPPLVASIGATIGAGDAAAMAAAIGEPADARAARLREEKVRRQREDLALIGKYHPEILAK
jgi:hypothetical protein